MRGYVKWVLASTHFFVRRLLQSSCCLLLPLYVLDSEA
jgi:hypothetical protein